LLTWSQSLYTPPNSLYLCMCTIRYRLFTLQLLSNFFSCLLSLLVTYKIILNFLCYITKCHLADKLQILNWILKPFPYTYPYLHNKHISVSPAKGELKRVAERGYPELYNFIRGKLVTNFWIDLDQILYKWYVYQTLYTSCYLSILNRKCWDFSQ